MEPLRMETERLTIRPWGTGDVEVYRMFSKDVGYNAFSLPGQFSAQDDEEIAAKIRKRVDLFAERRLGRFILEDRRTGEPVGVCGLEPYLLNGAETVELGYRLCLKHWGKGYATEAATALIEYGLNTLKVPEIHAFAVWQNPASLNVIEKLGFKFIGEFQHAELPHRLYSINQIPTLQAKARVLRFHHGQVSIPKGSEGKAREFYCGIIGLREVEKPASLQGRGGFWVQLGDIQVHFGAEDGVDRLATRSHLAYLVTDLSEWKARLKAAGIDALDGIPIPGYERFEFRDPFGNRVEFLEKITTS